jgi:hypothetical protein
MPDGSRGFSFAAILTVSGFKAITLPLGFRITVVGGIFGYDRTFKFEKLEARLKQGALNNLLFPPNPVANAPAILADIAEVFPPSKDRIIFAPMVRIVWGAEDLVSIDVAVLFEPPALRVAVLGKVSVFFPHRKAPLVEIHVHLIGDIDFDRRRIFAVAQLAG